MENFKEMQKIILFKASSLVKYTFLPSLWQFMNTATIKYAFFDRNHLSNKFCTSSNLVKCSLVKPFTIDLRNNRKGPSLVNMTGVVAYFISVFWLCPRRWKGGGTKHYRNAVSLVRISCTILIFFWAVHGSSYPVVASSDSH